jgi:hypothetical protein
MKDNERQGNQGFPLTLPIMKKGGWGNVVPLYLNLKHSSLKKNENVWCNII